MRDPHPPILKGKLYAYIGWIFDKSNCDTDLDKAPDLTKYVELVVLNKYHYLAPYTFLLFMIMVARQIPAFDGASIFSIATWGFFVPTLLSLQGATLVNAFNHREKPSLLFYRNFETDDSSTNNVPLCILTLGASFHNNHHHDMSAATTSCRWWELDLTYLTLRALSLVGIVWSLRPSKYLR